MAEEVAEAVSAAVVAEAASVVVAVRPLVPQTLFLVSSEFGIAIQTFDCCVC